MRTVLDCARFLPFDAALAVADSALRSGVTRTELLLACARLPRTGRARAFRVVELADARAANAFESVLRAVLMDVPGTHFEPQVWIGNLGRPDLVDLVDMVVVEADSFEFHSDSASLNHDMERYNVVRLRGPRGPAVRLEARDVPAGLRAGDRRGGDRTRRTISSAVPVLPCRLRAHDRPAN